MYKPLLTACRTLTIIRLPGADTKHFEQSLYGFPIVGALLGLLCLGFVWLFQAWFSSLGVLVEALILMALLFIVTGGLHWDGLADWADSKGAGQNRQRALEIMKDSSVGAFGVAALVLYGLLWSHLAAGLFAAEHWPRLFLVLLFSRTLQVEFICCYPYARLAPGMAAPFVAGANQWHRLVVLLLAVGISVPFFGESVFYVLAAGYMSTHLFGFVENRRLGGITGDLIGANNQLNEVILLIVLRLAPEPFIFGGWW